MFEERTHQGLNASVATICRPHVLGLSNQPSKVVPHLGNNHLDCGRSRVNLPFRSEKETHRLDYADRGAGLFVLSKEPDVIH